MRTTLDLDDTVLAAARSLARAKGISLGRAVSEIALRTLQPQEGTKGSTFVDVAYSPFPIVMGSKAVTDDIVAEYRDG